MGHTIVEWIGEGCCSVLVHKNGHGEVLDCTCAETEGETSTGKGMRR